MDFCYIVIKVNLSQFGIYFKEREHNHSLFTKIVTL